MKHFFLPLFVFLLLLVPLPGSAQLLDNTQLSDGEEPDIFEEGVDYERLPSPQPVRDPARVEVIEFFWYGCAACYRLEPVLRAWVSRQPEDVLFREIPAVWNPILETHARAYYTARALDILEHLHFDIFVRLLREGEPLNNKAQIRRFFALHKVSAENFNRAWDSFGVRSSVRQASARMRRYSVQGTPSIVVHGKYLVRSMQNTAKMFRIVDYLVARERVILLPANVPSPKTSVSAPEGEKKSAKEAATPGAGESPEPASAEQKQ